MAGAAQAAPNAPAWRRGVGAGHKRCAATSSTCIPPLSCAAMSVGCCRRRSITSMERIRSGSIVRRPVAFRGNYCPACVPRDPEERLPIRRDLDRPLHRRDWLQRRTDQDCLRLRRCALEVLRQLRPRQGLVNRTTPARRHRPSAWRCGSGSRASGRTPRRCGA